MSRSRARHLRPRDGSAWATALTLAYALCVRRRNLQGTAVVTFTHGQPLRTHSHGARRNSRQPDTQNPDRTCQAHPRPGPDGQNRQPIRSSAFILERKNQPSAGHMFCTMSVLLRRVNAYCLRILICQQKDFVFSKLPIDQQTDKTFLFIPAVGRRYGPAVKQVLRFRQRPGMAHQGQTRMICRAGGS